MTSPLPRVAFSCTTSCMSLACCACHGIAKQPNYIWVINLDNKHPHTCTLIIPKIVNYEPASNCWKEYYGMAMELNDFSINLAHE